MYMYICIYIYIYIYIHTHTDLVFWVTQTECVEGAKAPENCNLQRLDSLPVYVSFKVFFSSYDCRCAVAVAIFPNLACRSFS